MNLPASEVYQACQVCRRPRVVCVCDRVVSLPTKRRVLILQHPQEQDALLGSAQIVLACVPQAELVIGLSWRNLSHALERGTQGAAGETKPAMGNSGEEEVDPRKWAVLFPDREAEGNQVKSRRGTLLKASDLEGIIVLDGTWSKAKSLWWRNPWLNKLNRMSLEPKQPSIYGRLRAEPRKEYVSTLESVGAALTACGESEEVEKGLSRIFRTLMQRVRDANLAPEERKMSKPGRAPRPPKQAKPESEPAGDE